MDIQKERPVQHFTYDETKIYTPRIASQMKQNEPPCVFLDQAPVRIYERPLKNVTNVSEQNGLF